MEELIEEIVMSLEIGDHRMLDKPSLRGLFGLGVLASRALSGGRQILAPEVDVVHVVANPLAHGAHLAQATRSALKPPLRVVQVADARQATIPVDVNAPSLGARSMRRVLGRDVVRQAVRLRQDVPRGVMRRISTNVPLREYLFLAQAIRYRLATDVLAEVAPSTVVLTDFDRHAYARPWVWAARRHGLRTLTMVHGSPNRNYVPVLADTVLAWGQTQVDWFNAHSPDSITVIVGRPEIVETVRSAEPIKRAVVCHSAEDLSPSETHRLLTAIADLREQGVETVVRLHPSVRLSRLEGPWADIAKAADSRVTARNPFIESLRPGDGVMCVCSSAAVEALVSGFPVVVVADPEREVPVDLQALRVDDPVPYLQARELQEDLRRRVVALSGSAAAEHLRKAIANAVRH